MRTAALSILILLTIGCCISPAAEVTLSWDLNDPAPNGYRLFVRPDGGTYDYAAVLWEGAVPPAAVVVDDGCIWYFVVRAFCLSCGDPPGEHESADSNEVSYGDVVIPPVGLQTATNGFYISWEMIDVDILCNHCDECCLDASPVP